MNSGNDKDKELQRREQELQERENAIRIRELESEINSKEPPLHQTSRYRQGSLKSWQKKIVMAGKFFILVVAVIVSVKVATWIAGIIIAGALVFLSYKLFLESETKNH